MKKKMSFIGLLILVMIVSACGTNNSSSGNNKPKQGPTFNEVYTAVEATLKEELQAESGLSEDEVLGNYFIEDLTATDADMAMVDVLLERMELDPDKLANGKAIGALMNVNADEIFVLEAKEEDDVADLKASLEQELAAQIQTWEQYLPEQYEKVKNNVIQTNGKFLLYVTFSDSEKIADAFNQQFEK